LPLFIYLAPATPHPSTLSLHDALPISRAAMIDLNMAILRHKPLRDVHIRHDLDARDKRGMELLGRRRFFLQQSVNPVAQLQGSRSEEHTSELQSQSNLVCRLLLEKKKK